MNCGQFDGELVARDTGTQSEGLRGDDGFQHVIEVSSDLIQWTAVRTNVPVSGVVEWAETASDQKFFRAQVP